jgi:hypothetical protein
MTGDRRGSRRVNPCRGTLAGGTAEVRPIAADATPARQILDALNRCYPMRGRTRPHPEAWDSTGVRSYVTVEARKDGRTDG